VLKFYLHEGTAIDNPGGTLPGATNIAGLTITTTATGANSNRRMDERIGNPAGGGQQSAAVTTSAVTTAQISWFRRWMSRELAAQTLAAQTIAVQFGASESNANSDMFENGRWFLALWRPSTGAIVTTMVNDTGLMTEPGTTETNTSKSTTSTVATAQHGDILVLELFSAQNQAMATGYTNTIFFDGDTEGSITTNAAYLLFTNDVVLSTRQQPVNYASTAAYCRKLARKAWHRRKSGIFVPDLWVPEGATI
jgi:hypothetical protein